MASTVWGSEIDFPQSKDTLDAADIAQENITDRKTFRQKVFDW